MFIFFLFVYPETQWSAHYYYFSAVGSYHREIDITHTGASTNDNNNNNECEKGT